MEYENSWLLTNGVDTHNFIFNLHLLIDYSSVWWLWGNVVASSWMEIFLWFLVSIFYNINLIIVTYHHLSFHHLDLTIYYSHEVSSMEFWFWRWPLEVSEQHLEWHYPPHQQDLEVGWVALFFEWIPLISWHSNQVIEISCNTNPKDLHR